MDSVLVLFALGILGVAGLLFVLTGRRMRKQPLGEGHE